MSTIEILNLALILCGVSIVTAGSSGICLAIFEWRFVRASKWMLGFSLVLTLTAAGLGVLGKLGVLGGLE